jgi:uncharacterized protein YfaS (alpha-2-macroglobulin family)
VGSSSSTVAVTFPPAACTRAAPTVTLTPSGTVYASAGGSASYAVAVTNNDSCGCGASAFDLRAAVPSGWGATSARTASIAPADSGAANLTVTASSAAPAAFYTIPVSATNSSASASAGTVAATIAIAGAPPPPPPPPAVFAVSATTDKAVYALPVRGRTVNVVITARVVNGATAVGGAAVSVRVTAPGGSVTTLSGTSSAKGNVKVTYVLKWPAVAGTYQVTSLATKGAASSSGTTSFVAQ